MTMILLVTILGLTFSSFSDELDSHSLTIRTSANESKSYKLKKIMVSRPDANSSKEIIIETYGQEKCIIPIDKIVNNPRPNYQGCTHCFADDAEVENYYVQLFLNYKNPRITCDVQNGETIGFEFVGSTTINGKSMFVSKGLVFDMSVYTDGPFQNKPKKKNSVDRMLDDAADILMRMAF